MFFHSLGYYSSETKVLAGLCSLSRALGENLFLASSSFWWPQMLFGFWPHHCNLCLCGHMALSCVISLCLTLSRIFVPWCRPSVTIQDDLKDAFSSAKTLFPKKGHIHRLQGLQYRRIFFGPPYDPLQYGIPIHILFFNLSYICIGWVSCWMHIIFIF